MVKNPPATWETWVLSLGWEDPLEKGKVIYSSILRLPCGPVGKESACNVRDLGSIPWLGRSPGEGKGYPLQYSGLENSMECIAKGGAKSWTQLSDFYFHFHMSLNHIKTHRNRNLTKIAKHIHSELKNSKHFVI